MRRILTGLGAIALLTLLIVGLPILLIAIGPVGLPHVEPTLAGIWAALLRPDDGTLFLTLVKAAGWIVWALLTIAVLTELAASIRRLPTPHLPGLAVPQGVARALVAAAIALFLNTNTTLTAPPPASAHPAPAGAPAAPGKPPTAPADAARAAPAFERYTVKKGDILSQLALDHLGDARRYPEIYRASRNIDQPGGRRLTDPDVIDIGWKLNIPAGAEKPDRPDKTPKPEPAQPKPSATAPGSPTPPTVPTPGPTAPTAPVTHAPPSAEPVDASDADAPPAWLLGGLAGGGAVLAGALWLLLLRRRAIQHHHRRPGYVTAPPPPHTLPVEKTLRRHGQPVADLLILIDEALRRLALTLIDEHRPLPVLLAVQASHTTLRLHLADDADLPGPWQPGDTPAVWTLAVDDVPDDLEPLEPDGPAPWPHLATIGTDDAGNAWLLNLEVAGLTTIGGDPDYAADLARYLAAELATTPWSRDIQVDLIDIFDELTGLDPRRLRHHQPDGIDDTIRAAVDTIDRLNRLHEDDLPAARSAQAGEEIWPNRILITATTAGHFEQLAKLIGEQPRRTSIAALLIGTTENPGGPTIQISVGANGRAQIPALGLDLIANGITSEEARGCVQLIQAASQLTSTDLPVADADERGVRRYTDQAGRLRTAWTAPRDPDGSSDPDLSNLPQPDAVILAVAATTPEDLAILAPQIPEDTRRQLVDADLSLDQDLADWWSDACVRPRLSVLGRVRVRVGSGGTPAETGTRKPYYTELVAYLATKPAGATTDQLCKAFATNPARIHRDLGIVRKWLGGDPTTGRPHLPDADRPTAATNGKRVYHLDQMLSDADLFRRLRVRGQVRGEQGIEDYLKALELVTGRPYTQLRDGGGIWLASDRDDQHLLVGIVDVAHLTATMALQQGDTAAARRAANIAAAAAPDEEVPRADLAAIAQADVGVHAAATVITEAAPGQRDAEGPIEVSDRTAGLVQSRHWTQSAPAG